MLTICSLTRDRLGGTGEKTHTLERQLCQQFQSPETKYIDVGIYVIIYKIININAFFNEMANAPRKQKFAVAVG